MSKLRQKEGRFEPYLALGLLLAGCTALVLTANSPTGYATLQTESSYDEWVQWTIDAPGERPFILIEHPASFTLEEVTLYGIVRGEGHANIDLTAGGALACHLVRHNMHVQTDIPPPSWAADTQTSTDGLTWEFESRCTLPAGIDVDSLALHFDIADTTVLMTRISYTLLAP